MLRRFAASLLCLTFAPAAVRGDEGMWLMIQVDRLPAFARLLRIPVTSVYRPDGPCLARAVVEVGGGSGAFVSPAGLVLTNHHVVVPALVQLAREDRSVLRDGFYAARREEEAPIRNFRCRVTLACEEVTDQILAGLPPDLPEGERQRRVSARIRELLRQRREEAEGQGLQFYVREAYWGAAYFLYTTRLYEDVRLVYAPPEAIGQFGGDEDNWMWPRHSGDFAFVRVYAAPDGTPRRHHPENVPLRPEVWLRTRWQGPAAGEGVFVLGYPGSTYRHRSSFSVFYHREELLPRQLRQVEAMLRELKEMPPRPQGALRRMALENTAKNVRGKILWLKRLAVPEKMAREEEALRHFLAEHPRLRKRYGDVFDRLAAIYREVRERDRVNAILDQVRRPVLLRVARTLARGLRALREPEEKRPRRFRGEGWARTLARLLGRLKERPVKEDDERARKALAALAQLPPGRRPPSVARALARAGTSEREQAATRWAERVLAETQLRELERARDLFRRLRAGGAVEDPLLQVAAEVLQVEEGIPSQAAIAERLRRERRRLFRLRRAWKREFLAYPDADRTLRLTYGHVRGYRPRDAVVYEPFTTVRGILEKETGKPPYAAPPRLLEVLRRQAFGRWRVPALRTVPVAFLSDLDITGGNSGSPVLDARGRLVGVAFDGNWEGITSDYRYDPERTRTIAVHPAYAAFVLDRFSKADKLVSEWLGWEGR